MIKVLVVDDELSQRDALAHLVAFEGHQVEVAENGREAQEKLNKDIDLRLIITDLNMPVMDGFDLIRSIRSNESMYTYIIVLTSIDDRDSTIRALLLGANDYLLKPVHLEELKLRLNSAIRLLELEGQDQLLFSMAKMLEYRSDETGYHIERTYHYTRLIALDLSDHYPELKLTQSHAELIAKVCPLHDIGKVGVPDRILHKPGRLDEQEMEIMKTHASKGGNLLKQIYEKAGSLYLKYAHEIAMYHHERWDGGGYPDGLSGDEIPVSAHIMSLSDVYDALTSKRCYKEAFSHERAKAIILEDKGRAFSPMLIDSFLRVEDDFVAIKNKFSNEVALHS